MSARHTDRPAGSAGDAARTSARAEAQEEEGRAYIAAKLAEVTKALAPVVAVAVI